MDIVKVVLHLFRDFLLTDAAITCQNCVAFCHLDFPKGHPKKISSLRLIVIFSLPLGVCVKGEGKKFVAGTAFLNGGSFMDLNEIMEKLESIAFKISKPFCYECYKVAPTGTCSTCGSDDLMRVIHEVGCEYGTDWIIDDLIKNELEAIDEEELFESMIGDCYDEYVHVGFLVLNTVQTIKTQDPVMWRIARNDYIDGLAEDNQIVSFDNGTNYYWLKDVENLISKYEEAA